MARFDTTLKLLFQRSASVLVREIAGVAVARWLNVELPKVENPRVDLLGETADGQLIQFEFQTSNDGKMPLRMAEYYLGVYRQLERFPHQIVIFVGEEPLRMKGELVAPAMSHRYQLIDIRTLDASVLLDSAELDDNMLSILGRVVDERNAIRTILQKFGQLPPDERARAMQEFLVLANLRKLEKVVEEEARKMPSLDEVLANEVLGREYKKGELALLRRQLEKRFGPLPEWASERLSNSSPAELEEFGLRVLDAPNLEELLK